MSKFYKESNAGTTKNLYDKSKIYKSELLSLSRTYGCLVDFNFGEKYFYGRVDRNFVSMEPSTVLSRFSTIPNSSNDSGRVKVMSFVGEAFFGLSRHFRKSIQIGAIRDGDPYLSNLIAYTGYQDPKRAYQRYLTALTSAMSTYKKNKGFKITNFEQFIMFLKDFSMSVEGTYPVTKTGFIKSRLNPIVGNGLTIEVSDLSYTNDDQKINEFVNSSNFGYFLNACDSYGFMVDISAPWRLVADLDSVAMQGYAAKYGYTSTDAVIDFAFSKVHNPFFRTLPATLLTLYNNLSSILIEFDDCNNKTVIKKAERYTLEQINDLYNENYFIKLYCMLRFIEEESKHSEAKQDLIITDTVNLSNTKDLRTALGYFERFVSQPFDYRGSLSYLIRESEKREDR